MKKTAIRLLVGLVIIVIIAGVFVLTSAQRVSTQSASPTVTQLGVVKRTTLAAVVESSGSIQPQSSLNVNFNALGKVAQINVKVGDHVKQGDVLAKLDTAALELQLQQDEQALIIQQATYSQTLTADTVTISTTQAALDSAQAAYAAAVQQNSLSVQQVTISCANMTFAKNALDRAQTAYDRIANDNQAKKYLSGDWGPYKALVKGLDDAKTAYDVARASCNVAKGNINNAAVTATQSQVALATANLANLLSPTDATVAAAKAQLEQAQLNIQQTQLKLADAQIVAPFDGVVTKVVGSRGASGSSVSIGLADTRQYHIDVLVDEAEIAGVQVGQAADITLDGLPDTTLTGKVVRIDPSGALVQGVINYNVQIDLDPTTVPLRLSLTANARIIQASHADVLSVPRAALHTAAATGQIYVEVINQSGQQPSTRRVDVTLGLTAGTLAEVAGDLTAGEYVTLNGHLDR